MIDSQWCCSKMITMIDSQRCYTMMMMMIGSQWIPNKQTEDSSGDQAY